MQALEIMRPIRSLRHRFPNPNPNPRPLLRLYSSWSVATTYDPVAGRFVTKRTQLPPNLPLATDSTTIYGDVKGTPVPDDEIGTRRYGDVMGTTSPIPTPSSVPADEIGTRRYGDVMDTNSDEIGTRRYGDFIGRNTSNSTPYADGRRHNFASHQPSNSRQRELRWTGPAQTPEKYSAVVDRTRNGSRMYEDGAGSTTSNSKPYMEAAYKPEKTSFIADQNAGSRRTYEYANETASSSSNSQHFTDATGKMEKMSTIDDQSCGRRMHGYVTGMSSTSSSNSKPHTDATSKLEKSSTIDDQSSGRRRHNYVTGMSSSSSCSNSKPHTDAADTLEKTSMVADQSRIRSSSSNSGPYAYASDKLEKTCIVDQSSGISSIMDKDVIGTSSSNSNPYPDVADTPEKTSVVTDQTSCSYISSGVYGDMMGTSSSDSEPDPIDTDKPEKRSVVADQSSAGSRICSDLIGTGSSSSSSRRRRRRRWRKSKPEPIAADKPSKPLKAINTSVVDESSDSSWEDIDVTTRYNNKQKKGKSKGLYVCRNCGYTDGQWWGTCRECGEVGKMMSNESSYMSRVKVSDNAVRSWFPKNAAAATPIKLSEVRSQISHINWRIPLTGPFGTEVARVLGGGLVPGSLVLVGGDPGVGKSTMLLQIAAVIAQANDVNGQARVMYVSGEESVEQIGNRADRLNIQTDELYLHSSTDVEEILEQAQHLSPKALVIDSIQTVYLSGVTGSAGGVSQLKECTSALLRFAKKTNIAVFLIGHVTKSGEIAGPRVFEHIVDVVLYMEGEKLSSHRLLRSVKNRFGSTDELGVFEMSNSGLQAVSNPIGMFLGEQFSKSDYLAGLAVAVILDGSRAFLIEVQALCVVGSSSLRHVNGVQNSRADMIISVLTKQAAVKLQENGIFINVISGTNLTERAGDLAIAAAICSSYMERPVPNDTAFIAEIGLGGELRMVPQLEKRVKALAKLGFRRCIVPKSAEKSFAEMYESQENLEIVGCLDLKEMINIVF